MKIKQIKPLFTSVVTTMERYVEDVKNESGLISTTQKQGDIKEYQRVVAIGSSVRDIEVGDLVSINPSRYAVRKHIADSLKNGVITDNPITSYNFNVVEIDGIEHLLLQDRDIDFVITDSEE